MCAAENIGQHWETMMAYTSFHGLDMIASLKIRVLEAWFTVW